MRSMAGSDRWFHRAESVKNIRKCVSYLICQDGSKIWKY